jgi:hypothetical protein
VGGVIRLCPAKRFPEMNTGKCAGGARTNPNKNFSFFIFAAAAKKRKLFYLGFLRG